MSRWAPDSLTGRPACGAPGNVRAIAVGHREHPEQFPVQQALPAGIAVGTGDDPAHSGPPPKAALVENGYGKLRRCSERNARVVDFTSTSNLYLAAALVTIRQLIQRARKRYRCDTQPTTKRLKLPQLPGALSLAFNLGCPAWPEVGDLARRVALIGDGRRTMIFEFLPRSRRRRRRPWRSVWRGLMGQPRMGQPIAVRSAGWQSSAASCTGASPRGRMRRSIGAMRCCAQRGR
jgi:hypothetical protein